MAGKTTYVKSFTGNVQPAGGLLNSQFKILSPGNNIRVRRISLSWLLNIDDTMIQTRSLQQLWLNIGYAGGNLPVQKFAKSFTNISASPGMSSSNASAFVLFASGDTFTKQQWEFDNLEVPNELLFKLEFINNDPLKQCPHSAYLIVETFEEIIY